MRIDDLQTPALLVRLEHVRANLARMQALLAPHGGLARWRPHVKTAKTPAVLGLLLDAGLRSFKCATTREALVLLELAELRRAPIDLLVAMTHRGANLARVAGLARRFERQRVSVLTEDPEHAFDVRALGARLELFVDLDPHFGRSGIPLDDRARIAATIEAASDALAGLHAYEGQVRAPTAAERALACAPLFDAVVEIAREHGLERRETITSGTPTFLQALEHRGLAALRHTVSPGIVVYWDLGSEALGIEGFTCAATVLARVISAPRTDRVTLDAGSKSLDAAVGDPCVTVVGHPELVAQKPSEEHLPLAVRSGSAPAAGKLLELVPRHVCPMINLADDVVLLEGDEIVGLERIAARGHELAG